jgi:hypothetical protein
MRGLRHLWLTLQLRWLRLRRRMRGEITQSREPEPMPLDADRDDDWYRGLRGKPRSIEEIRKSPPLAPKQ